MICQEFQRKCTYIDDQLADIQDKLSTLPEGNLICAKNGNGAKWYNHTNLGTSYIPKGNRVFAEDLAARKYLSLLAQELQREQNAMKSYIKKHDTIISKSQSLLAEDSPYRELLMPYFTSEHITPEKWAKLDYHKCQKNPENLIHHTVSGNIVRSKSEAIIDMALFLNHIPYRYECALELENYSIYPDFTICHPITGKILYWEHFGMMDNDSYCANAFQKIQLYLSCGILPGKDLIMTFETKSDPLSSEQVDAVVRQFLK